MEAGKKAMALSICVDALLGRTLFATIAFFTVLAACGIYLATGLARGFLDPDSRRLVLTGLGTSNALKSLLFLYALRYLFGEGQRLTEGYR